MTEMRPTKYIRKSITER